MQYSKQNILLNKSNRPLGCFCRDIIQRKYEVFLEKLHHALWRSAMCISRCLTLLSKEQYPFQKSQYFCMYMQYYWHRAPLSKVQYVWNCEHYHTFKKWLIENLNMHILQITIFFKRGAVYTKGCYSQNMVRCLGKRSHYAFRKMMCNCEGHIWRAYMYHVLCI